MSQFDFQSYLCTSLVLYIFSYVSYYLLSPGIGNKEKFLQMRRFLPCALVAALPASLAGFNLFSSIFFLPLTTGLLWCFTFPALYYINKHKTTTFFTWHFDFAFGLYIIAWLSSLEILFSGHGFISYFWAILVSITEFFLLLIVLFELFYYIIYQTVISENGLMVLIETHMLEVKEYLTGLPITLVLAASIIVTGMLTYIFYFNLIIMALPLMSKLSNTGLVIMIILLCYLTFYLWRPVPEKGLFARTGLIELYIDVKNYISSASLYKEHHLSHLKELSVSTNMNKLSSPHTIILVIGESASRTLMSAFTTLKVNTTPWLKEHATDEDFFLFSHAYTCWGQTVPSLERALTEFNQYNDKTFNKSFSIIDIAKKAGYTTWWYSNQGYLGSSATPVTLVAQSSDISRWTLQDANVKQYDSALLDYLKKIPTNRNNFIVLHLKGSHYNYQSRYPKSFAKFGNPSKYNVVDNYNNSICYTDYILQEIQQYAAENMNLHSMVYFSDHGDVPNRRRQPDFSGFGGLRIPLFVYLSAEYKKMFPDTARALRNNTDKYFTNDLIYELMCGLLQVKSGNYDSKNSIATEDYKWSRETLRTNLGKTLLTEDTTEDNKV
ncbi:MAG: phosphoethanolamine transferase [Acidaminococcaceae bacterium]|nr:phosphoethanolamine transferase [Acidaminococcaceae bacterium]